MNFYCDSSLLFKLYVAEQDSEMAVNLVMSKLPPIPISSLHEIEIRNSIRQRCFGKMITSKQAAEALNKLTEDLERGFFERISTDWSSTYRRAEDLSQHYGETMACRSLDILHVATALIWEVREFLTFDLRQYALARKAGLLVKP